jgi:hypothetical protein
MDLDLPEGEPRRAEDLTGRGGTGRWEAGGSGWTTRPWRPWGAVAAVAAILAIVTRSPWWTLLAVFACLAGIAILAWRSGDSRPREPLGPRRAGGIQPRKATGTRAAGLTLRSSRADLALLAVRSRLARRTGGPRRTSGTWSANDTSGAARRALRKQEPGGDSGGEGQGG